MDSDDKRFTLLVFGVIAIIAITWSLVLLNEPTQDDKRRRWQNVFVEKCAVYRPLSDCRRDALRLYHVTTKEQCEP